MLCNSSIQMKSDQKEIKRVQKVSLARTAGIQDNTFIISNTSMRFGVMDVPSLLPSHSYDRSQARFWTAYIDDKLFPVMNELSAATKEEEVKAVVSKMLEGLILLDGAFVMCSKGKAYFNGDSIGYLDIALGCELGCLKVIDGMTDMKLLDETKVPNIVGWAEKFCQDPAVKDVISGVDRLWEFYKLYLARK
ncbi:transferase [Lithospermum erythrorhizon]|uniref:glutathione transferase n=1 Tax=Lithospermum erythrorhizon TaxID=34254 RepID=A0AAV3P0B8_LITER